MAELTTPESKDWNHYWSLDKTQRFTKVSWSKRRIINVLNQYLPNVESVLDAGCGSGFFSKYFCDQGKQTVALDYSQEALLIAEKLTGGKVQTVQEDLLKEGLDERLSKKFDLIFTDGLFEHFSDEDQNRIYQNFLSVLSPDGVIVTFVPNKFSPWELIRPIYMPGIEEDPFTLKQLVNLCERNKTNVLQKGGLNTIPFALSPDKLFGSLFGMLLFSISKRA